MSLVQRQRSCDGRTYQAETVELRVDGGWRNEDAVVQQLERPVCTAQTDNLVPDHASTCTQSSQACMRLDFPQPMLWTCESTGNFFRCCKIVNNHGCRNSDE